MGKELGTMALGPILPHKKKVRMMSTRKLKMNNNSNQTPPKSAGFATSNPFSFFKSKAAAQFGAGGTKPLTSFLLENRIPRLFLFAIMAVKMTTMYDKLKQLVAIRNIYGQIVIEQRQNLRTMLREKAGDEVDGISQEDMLQDLLTRRQMQLEEMIDEVEKKDGTGGVGKINIPGITGK